MTTKKYPQASVRDFKLMQDAHLLTSKAGIYLSDARATLVLAGVGTFDCARLYNSIKRACKHLDAIERQLSKIVSAE